MVYFKFISNCTGLGGNHHLTPTASSLYRLYPNGAQISAGDSPFSVNNKFSIKSRVDFTTSNQVTYKWGVVSVPLIIIFLNYTLYFYKHLHFSAQPQRPSRKDQFKAEQYTLTIYTKNTKNVKIERLCVLFLVGLESLAKLL